MNKFTIIFACVLLSCHSAKHTTMSSSNNSALEGGWVPLFDGSSTSAWHTYGKSAAGKAWTIDNGTLRLDPSVRKNAPGEGGDLVTNEEYENFDLKLEWKISPKGNSGIIFYVHEDPATYRETYQTGLEMQVLDNGTPTVPGHPDGKIYTHRAGDLYDLLASKEVAKPTGEWNEVEVVSKQGKLDFYMNGQHTLSTTLWNDNWRQMIAISKFKDMKSFGTFNKGRIALQDHGNEVWFRNIRIKKL